MTHGTERPSLLVSSCPSKYDTWPATTITQAGHTTESCSKHDLLYHQWSLWCFQRRVCCCVDPVYYYNLTAIGELFGKRWQCPHCCGILDGKHLQRSDYMSLEYWLFVKKLQEFYCPGRRRLQVSMDWCQLWWVMQRCQYLQFVRNDERPGKS